MHRRVNPVMIGAFVLGALALAVISIVLFSSENLFHKQHLFALYFSSDVNGLKVGAPVKFRGVEIGSVVEISLNIGPPTSNALARAGTFRIPVVIDLDTRQFLARGISPRLDEPSRIALAIKLGLRGQLDVESILTGLLSVDLDFHQNSPAVFYMGDASPYPEIPTVPTTLEQAQTVIAKALIQIEKIDFDLLIKSLTSTASAITNLVNSPKLMIAVDSLNEATQALTETSKSIRQLADNMNRQVAPMGADLRITTAQARATLKQTQLTLAAVQDAVSPGSPLGYEIGETLKQSTDAARALKDLADYLQRNPSAIVRGRYTGPPPGN